MNKTLHVPCVPRETALAIITGHPPVSAPQSPRLVIPLTQHLPAAGDQSPQTWPATWDMVPSACPVCGFPTVPDPYLDSSRGPGWKCTAGSYHHYWMVRMEPMRRYVAAHPPQPSYPWYDTPPAERQAWLEEHYHPPRPAPSNEGGTHHALDRKTESTS
jgi:hypothetical protein